MPKGKQLFIGKAGAILAASLPFNDHDLVQLSSPREIRKVQNYMQ